MEQQNSQPVTYIKALVVKPSYAVTQHTKIQQHVSLLMDAPGAARQECIVAIKRGDLRQIFDVVPKEFYVMQDGILTYVYLKQDVRDDEHECFGYLVRLNQEVVRLIFESDDTTAEEVFNQETNGISGCWMRMVALAEESRYRDHGFDKMTTIITEEEYENLRVQAQFNRDLGWDEHMPWADEEKKPTVSLAHVPLTSRANRILVRNALDTLMDRATKRSANHPEIELPTIEQLAEQHGVYLSALCDLAEIDALPDAEYVEAMVKFKKAEVTKYHMEAIRDEKTTKPLNEWVLEMFGEEFESFGRRELLAEIANPFDADGSGEQEDIESPEPAIFVVGFDGCIVEDRRPVLGPESPFAISVLQALQANGHAVIILHDRDNEELNTMDEFFASAGFLPNAFATAIGARGIRFSNLAKATQNGGHPLLDFEVNEMEEDHIVPIDYLIDNRSFLAPSVEISGGVNCPSTMYWGDFVSPLVAMGYLKEDQADVSLSATQQ